MSYIRQITIKKIADEANIALSDRQLERYLYYYKNTFKPPISGIDILNEISEWDYQREKFIAFINQNPKYLNPSFVC